MNNYERRFQFDFFLKYKLIHCTIFICKYQENGFTHPISHLTP